MTSDDGEDVFVHVSGLSDQVRDGEAVQFNLKPGKEGMVATDVKKIT